MSAQLNQKVTLTLEGEKRSFHFETYGRCGETLDALCKHNEIEHDVLLTRMMRQFLKFCHDSLSGCVNDDLIRLSSAIYQMAFVSYPVTCCECGAESSVSDPNIAAMHPTLCPDCYETLTNRFGDGQQFVDEMHRRYGSEKGG